MFSIYRIHQNISASGFVVIGHKPLLDKIHDLVADTIFLALKFIGDRYPAYKHRRISSALLVICNGFMKMSFRVILKMSGLNACISKCNKTDNLSDVLGKHPTIRFAHQIFLIGKSIVIKEIIKVIFST